MKNHSKIILFVIILINVYGICLANTTLSSFLSFFQKDLVLELIYKTHNNLRQGNYVYLANDFKNQKTLIGKVTKVSLVEPQISKVKIQIDKQYRKKIYKTMPFVLVSNIFSQNANAYIVAISSADEKSKKLLKSGSSIKGITFLEYKFAMFEKKLNTVINSIGKQNKELMVQLEEYIETFNIEEFQKKIDRLTKQIIHLSKEQKETFKNNVLPALQNMFNIMIKKLEKHNNKEKSKKLDKQLKEIEKIINV